MKFLPLNMIVLTLGLAGATAHAQHHAGGGNPLPSANNPLAQLNGFGTGYNNPLQQGAGFGAGFNNPAAQGGGFSSAFGAYNQSFAQPTIIVGGGYNSGFGGYGYNNYNYYSNQGFGYGGGYALTPNPTGMNGNGFIPNGNGLNPNVGGAVRSNPNVSAVLNGTNATAIRPSSKAKSSKSTKRTSSRRR